MSESLVMTRRPPSLAYAAPFGPSIAQGGNYQTLVPRGGSAIWAFRLRDLLSLGILPTSSFVAPKDGTLADAIGRQVLGETDAQVGAKPTQDMVAALKAGGLPIAAIADILGVERKTVYSWLDGVEALAANHERLRVVHNVLAGVENGALKYYHRLWERKLPDGSSLKALLMAGKIDEQRLRGALLFLRPVVTRGMTTDAQRRDLPSSDMSPAASLTLQLRAGF
jgi:hypothetical protein